MVTKEDAVAGHREFWHATAKNTDGTPFRVRANGKCKTWKTRPAEFRLSVKQGLYNHGEIDHNNAYAWCLPERWAVEQHYTK